MPVGLCAGGYRAPIRMNINLVNMIAFQMVNARKVGAGRINNEYRTNTFRSLRMGPGNV